MSQTTSTTYSSFYQSYYFPDALEYAKPLLRKAQFAKYGKLEQGKFAKQVAWMRPNVPDDSEVITITEGSASSDTSATMTLTKITGDLVQYGTSVAITDIVTLTEAFDSVEQSKVHLGENVGLKVDSLVRNEIAVGSTVVDRYPSGLSTQNFATLSSTSGAAATLKLNDVVFAVTNLKINRAPIFAQKGYVMVVDPAVAADISLDNQFRNTVVYNGTERLFEGEVGKIAGVTVIEDTNPFRETVENTFAASGAIYSNLVFGRDAFGTADISTQTMQPNVYILDEAEKGDIYNTNIIVACKFYMTQKVLNGNWIVNLRSKVNYA